MELTPNLHAFLWASSGADWLLSGHGDVISGSEAVRENFGGVERTWFRYT